MGATVLRLGCHKGRFGGRKMSTIPARECTVSGDTRNARTPKRNSKGQRPVKVGGRSDYRVFKFSKHVSEKEADARTIRLKEVYDVCGGWNDLSNFIAESVRNGVVPVPLPNRELSIHLGMEWDGWVRWRKLLVTKLPSIPWATLSEANTEAPILAALRSITMDQLNEAAATIASLDQKSLPVVAPIAGSLHEALTAYQSYIVETEPNNTDRHSKIRQLIERHSDQPLATLGLDACRDLFNYWRQRAPRLDGKGQYSPKRSREQLAELVRFFEWMHLSEKFAWREPNDFHRLDRSISKEGSDRKSLKKIVISVFNMNDLATLVRHADMPEKLWIIWCLNTAHGAAEVGRVQWEDIYLNQDHPWRSDGLKIWEGGDWIGFLRPKTDVLGWWFLWPETVELLKQWKDHCEKNIFKRMVTPEDILIVRKSGSPLYGTSKNGQSGFANSFKSLKKSCKRTGNPVANLPPGTLRDQFSDWCGGDEAEATVASVALTHGTPHGTDKLLYKHYSNRPWRKLFEKQIEFRDYCRPVLNAINEPKPLSLKRVEFSKVWPGLTGTKMDRVSEAAVLLEVSKSTIYRYLEDLNEPDSSSG